jgi:hypothetical protein
MDDTAKLPSKPSALNPLKLFAPAGYWTCSDSVRLRIVSGCGPGGGWKALLVPETLWGLSVNEACNIHDWMYHVGETIEEKKEADRVFLNNMIRIIDAKTRWNWLKRLRLRRAKIYYLAVCWFGGPAFWAGKNMPEEERSIEEVQNLSKAIDSFGLRG